MRKNVFVNNLKYIISSSVLSVFYWWVTNRELLSEEVSYELFRELNASIYGYDSLQSYFLIYLAPYFILLHSFLKDETDYRIVRLKGRKTIAVERINMLMKAVGIVLIPHFSMQILGNVYIFWQTPFISLDYFMVELLQVVNTVIFFTVLGLCFEYVILYVKKEISLFLIVVPVIYYFGNRIFLEYLLLKELCIKDLIIGGSYTVSEFVILLIKNLTIIFVLVELIIIRLKESDVYER